MRQTQHRRRPRPYETEPETRTHEGYDWVCVLEAGCVWSLATGTASSAPGEAAEFDTRVPHWRGSADAQPVELLVLFGRQGERAHLGARTT